MSSSIDPSGPHVRAPYPVLPGAEVTLSISFPVDAAAGVCTDAK